MCSCIVRELCHYPRYRRTFDRAGQRVVDLRPVTMPLKLLSATPSPFAQNCVAMLKKGISCATPKQDPPAQKRTPNTKYNPLQRLPILLIPDDPNSELVHDSAHIQDYLVTKFASMEPKLLTNDVDIDLKAKKIQISVEGVMFAFVTAFFELGREESKRSQGWLEQQNRKVAGSIGAFNDLARKRKGECLIVDGREKTIADIAVVCAVGHIDFVQAKEGWREEFPELAKWFDVWGYRTNFASTRPVMVDGMVGTAV